jgi:hypothetical protein
MTVNKVEVLAIPEAGACDVSGEIRSAAAVGEEETPLHGLTPSPSFFFDFRDKSSLIFESSPMLF